MIHSGKENVLQPLLDQAFQEEKTVGHPAKKTLLTLALFLVRWAPNFYSSMGDPSYSKAEKDLAIQLLTKYGYSKLCNLSPRYKKATLAAIEAELKEA